MEKTKIDFYSKNQGAIEDLVIHIKEFERYLKTVMVDVAKRIEFETYKTANIECFQWPTKGDHQFKDLLVHDIIINDSQIAIDSCIYPGNIYIEIFLRKAGKNALKNKDELNTYLISKKILKNGTKPGKERYVYKKYFSNQPEMVDVLNQIIQNICL